MRRGSSPRSDPRGDLRGDTARLGDVVVVRGHRRRVDLRRVAASVRGGLLARSGGQLERARAAPHELVRDREDRGIRSVVRLEPNDAGILVGAGEVEQEARVGPRERVDRLAGIADDADVAAIAAPQLEQPVLERRHVLELVDGEVAVLLVDGCGDVRLRLEHPRARQQDILEVELSPLVLELLVRALQVGDP